MANYLKEEASVGSEVCCSVISGFIFWLRQEPSQEVVDITARICFARIVKNKTYLLRFSGLFSHSQSSYLSTTMASNSKNLLINPLIQIPPLSRECMHNLLEKTEYTEREIKEWQRFADLRALM